MGKRSLLLLALVLSSAASAAPRRISRAELEDRIRGGWAGQMIAISRAIAYRAR